jgi:hypothetical protein
MIHAQRTLFDTILATSNPLKGVLDTRADGSRFTNCDHFEGCDYPWASILSVTVVAEAGS